MMNSLILMLLLVTDTYIEVLAPTPAVKKCRVGISEVTATPFTLQTGEQRRFLFFAEELRGDTFWLNVHLEGGFSCQTIVRSESLEPIPADEISTEELFHRLFKGILEFKD